MITVNPPNKPQFGVWAGRRILTARIFGRLFQVKLVRDEIYSQRQDQKRIRFCGLSVKI